MVVTYRFAHIPLVRSIELICLNCPLREIRQFFLSDQRLDTADQDTGRRLRAQAGVRRQCRCRHVVRPVRAWVTHRRSGQH